jgi:g-D-glutamyl-meso-diaminopimelate peptidase
MSDIFSTPQAVSAADIDGALRRLDDGDFIRARSAGRSVCGRPITALEIGAMKRPVFIAGGTHGMEWASALAALRLARETALAIGGRTAPHGLSLKRALGERGAVIVPLLNPDGYEIWRSGQAAAPKRARLLARFGGDALKRWQANANGVDINHNFPAGFYRARRLTEAMGVYGPGPTRYGGRFPFSEPESRAALDICRRCRPRALYSLHSQGEEIYWRYGENIPAGSKYIASLLSRLTGYRLCDPEAAASHAGLKDWFIKRYRRPGFTIELGLGQNPLPFGDFETIWSRIERALFVAMII